MRRARSGFTLVELLIVVAIMASLMAIGLPAVMASRERARGIHCSNNLKQIGAALHNYHQVNRTFPAGYWSAVDPADHDDLGPGWGWAAAILSHIEQKDVYQQTNRRLAVEAPENEDARMTSLPCYICPSDSSLAASINVPDYATGATICSAATASYVANVGSVRQTCKHCREYCDGVFGRNTHIRLSDIIDGTSQTIAAGERSHNISTPIWAGVVAHSMLPDRMTPGKMAAGPGYVLGTTFLHGDPHVLDTRSHDTVAEIFASMHPAVMNFVFCDGSVRSIDFEIDDTVYMAMSTRSGREPNGGVVHSNPLPSVPPPTPPGPPPPPPHPPHPTGP